MLLPDEPSRRLTAIVLEIRERGNVPLPWLVAHPHLLPDAWAASDDPAAMAEVLRVTGEIDGERVWCLGRNMAVQLDERHGRYAYACLFYAASNRATSYLMYFDGVDVPGVSAETFRRVAAQVRADHPVPPPLHRILEAVRAPRP